MRRRRFIGLVAAVAALAISETTATAQAINPALLAARWQASWIGPADAPLRGFGVYHFRRTFDLPSVPSRFVIHVSADNRYQLFVNGTRVLSGPARGDLDHWRFETADIAQHLAAGRNVLAAVVWNYAEHAPMAQMSYRTAFIVQGDSEAEHVVNTGPGWKAVRDEGRTLLPLDRAAIFYEYFVAGPGEQLEASAHAWGWETRDFDDSAWPAAIPITIGAPRGIRDTPSRWMLVPRSIPLMEERRERFERVARSEPLRPPPDWLAGKAAWTIPAHTTVRLLLDRGHLTTAYPELRTTGGRGASISLVYTEALQAPRADGRRGSKGHRDEVEGKVATGLRDRFLPDGGAGRTFRPLWWRTYRYVDVEITTAGEPLVLEEFAGVFTAYPFEQRAEFESSDPQLARIWDVSWRTARLCAHETYMDTPYWEQLQYIGDTRIQALISMYVAGDDRLVRNALTQFDDSRIPDGLTQSRYPTDLPQIIPPFSLFWIGMIHDFYTFSGDAAFARRFLPGVRGVLHWFTERVAPTGLLGRLEWWNFADWVDGRGFQSGVPPQDGDGQSAILSLQLVLALREAADLEDAFGSPGQASEYRRAADGIVDAVRRLTWDASRGLFADTPSRQTYSQHVNALAILADVLPAPERAALMRRVLDDGSLTQATYYFRFYVFRAMKNAGLADEYLAQLGPWHEMLKLGLTTWAERPEPTRSDSHAWSAHPAYDLLTTVAGIEPSAPGFATVRIAPHLGPLESLRASVPSPKGRIEARYVRRGNRLSAEVTLPPGVTGVLHWGGRTVALQPGRQQVDVP
ncbi:MAG TPA: alpha-L-rhamnosidase C-terminal domain-containing protein [Vicinamibacterales bacterium]|nr:alpha-L-rhamnosidase C-terminal domain-containing protein [Vicinamibacterales bacterium]